MSEPPQPPQQPPYGPPYPPPDDRPGGYPPQPWEQQGYPQPAPGPQPPFGHGAPYGAPYGGPPDVPGPYGPQDEPGPQRLRLDFGGRLQRRPEPRFGVSLAAAGIGIAIVGILVWSFGYLIQGVHVDTDRGRLTGDDRRFLGFGLSLVLVLAGYALAVLRRRGPLATAGAVGGALGVPVTLAFLSLDLTGAGSDGPFNADLVYLFSVIVWLASYLFVPGMRGRSFQLAAAALVFAGYVEFKTVSDVVGRATADVFGSGSASPDDFSTGGAAAVGLIFGLLYYAGAALLDRRGMAGASVALAVAGAATTVGGVLYGILTFKQIGTGVELIVLGALLSWYGAWSGRRFTTWFWMFALVVGFGLVVQKALPDSPAGAGITLILIGLAVVALAPLASSLLHEAPDLPAPAGAGAVPTGRRH